MTEKELSQLYWLGRETEKLQKDLQNIEIEIANFDGYKGAALSHEPKTAGKMDTFNILIELLDEKALRQSMLEVNLLKIQRERNRLDIYISSIEDSQLRLIFRLRHINCMTWEDIAAEMMVLDEKGSIVKCQNRSTITRKYKKFLNAHIAH